MEKIKDKSFTELSATQKGNVRKIIERERQATKIAEKDRDIAEQKAKYAAEQADRTQQLFEAEKRRSSFLEELNSPKVNFDALVTHVIKQFSQGMKRNIDAT